MKGKFQLTAASTLLLFSSLAGQTIIASTQSARAAESQQESPAISSQPASAASTAASKASSLVGKAAPNFSLNDSTGAKRALSDAANKVLVLEWTNFDCPFVKKQYNSGQMQKLQKTFSARGIVWYSICSSAEGRQGNYPAAKINELIKQYNATPTAYLFDPDGTVGHAYGATATPHVFVINQKGIIVYAGAVDDNPSADISDKAGTNYVQQALEEVLANKSITVSNTKAVGCSVKYKS